MTALLALAAPDDGPPAVLETGPGADAVLAAIRRIAAGWPATEPGAASPGGRLEVAGPGRWRLLSTALQDGVAEFDNLLAAANAAIGVLIAALLAPRPHWLCLHAAALDLPGQGGMLLPGDHMAGKSLFSAVAAAAGAGLLADDRALVRLGPEGGAELVALGVQPKLRQPLPAELPADIAAFLSARLGAAEGGMRFLALEEGGGPGRLRPFGSRLALRRILFLARRHPPAGGHDGLPRLAPLGAAAAMARLLPGLHAPGRDAAGRLRAAQQLVGAGGAGLLCYRDCWTALDLLAPAAAAERKPSC